MKIDTAPAIRRLNGWVHYFDAITFNTHDRTTAEEILAYFGSIGAWSASEGMREAMKECGYFDHEQITRHNAT